MNNAIKWEEEMENEAGRDAFKEQPQQELITVFELSDNFDLSGFQTDSMKGIADMLDSMITDYVKDGYLKEGDEYELTVKITKMTQEEYDNLPEYSW